MNFKGQQVFLAKVDKIFTPLKINVSNSSLSFRFAAFEYFKNHMVDDSGKLTQIQTVLAGLGAGVSEAILVVCPMETIKVKFIHDQTQPNPKFKGFFSGVATIVKTEGTPFSRMNIDKANANIQFKE